MNSLQDLDKWLLLKINLDWAHPWLDLFFTSITDYHKTQSFYYVFLPGFLFLLVYLKRKSSALILLFLFLSLGTSDYFGGKILKPYFERFRPPVAGIDVVLRAPHFGGYSFPSNHAINIFCAATFLGFCFPRAKYFLFLFAFFIAYSRVYVGVHYPVDVIAGAILGSLFGYLGFKSYEKLRKII